jgi:hypothetical protein
MEHALHRRAADLALGHLIVADPLRDLELMALLAPVFVNGHRFREYSWHSRRQSANRVATWARAGRAVSVGGRRLPSTAAAHATRIGRDHA